MGVKLNRDDIDELVGLIEALKGAETRTYAGSLKKGRLSVTWDFFAKDDEYILVVEEGEQ